MPDDLKTFLMVVTAVLVAGVILKFGEDLPLIEQAHEGFGG